MKKLLINLMMLLFVAGTVHAFDMEADVTVVTYEEGHTSIATPSHWGGVTATVIANPVSDDVNASDSCITYERREMYGAALNYENFEQPVSIFGNPLVKLKVMTQQDAGLAKNIKVKLVDVYGTSVAVNQTTSDSLGQWEELTFDFSDKLKSSPIVVINKLEIQINAGVAVDTTKAFEMYYVDDIVLTGENVNLSENDVATLYQETLNATWNNDRNFFKKIGDIKGKLNGGESHYYLNDTVGYWYNWWNANVFSFKLSPAAEGTSRDQLRIINSIVGKKSFVFSYEFKWAGRADLHSSQTAPSVEYKVDEGDWISVSPTNDLATSHNLTKAEYDLGDLAGDSLVMRIKDTQDASVFIDNLKLDGKNTFASSIEISGASTLDTTVSKTLQLSSATLPANANQAAYWFVSSGDNIASVDSNTGLLTVKNTVGTVEVIAIAIDKTGLTFDTHTVTVTGDGTVTSIDADQAEEVNIYLNNATDLLYVNATAELSKVSIYSLSGQSVATYTSGLDMINVSNLSAGVYVVEARFGNETKIQKIIKE